MAATLARMERDGLIERRPDPADGRSSLFGLAPSVRDQTGAIQAAIASLNEEVLQVLTGPERTLLRESLTKVIAAVPKSGVE